MYKGVFGVDSCRRQRLSAVEAKISRACVTTKQSTQISTSSNVVMIMCHLQHTLSMWTWLCKPVNGHFAYCSGTLWLCWRLKKNARNLIVSINRWSMPLPPRSGLGVNRVYPLFGDKLISDEEANRPVNIGVLYSWSDLVGVRAWFAFRLPRNHTRCKLSGLCRFDDEVTSRRERPPETLVVSREAGDKGESLRTLSPFVGSLIN